MTVAVGFLCTDGVVLGVDSMITPTMGGLNVGHHKGRKLEVLSGQQIYSFAGDLGQAHRFRLLAQSFIGVLGQARNAFDYPLFLSQSMIQQLGSTGIAINNIGVNAFLAFEYGDIRQCCVFEGAMQPRLLDDHHYYVALGSGKLSADPFLRFLVDIFCNGPPTIREAIFLTTWTIQHVIDTNPGGVAGPIRIAVLERFAESWQARELPDDEIAEHQEAVVSASDALRHWRNTVGTGTTTGVAEEPPEPPAAPPPIPTPELTSTSSQGLLRRRVKPLPLP